MYLCIHLSVRPSVDRSTHASIYPSSAYLSKLSTYLESLFLPGRGEEAAAESEACVRGYRFRPVQCHVSANPAY